ncbi:MAG: indoleacetamide hydrolase, partial [Actinomycetota bacterium]
MSMVGRTNSPAFAMRFHTENELHGETLNPHRRDISCGGSSGGAGAAVATGMCHIGQGNDVAGSVRWPAYMNGVIGLRPTIGRMPSGGTNPNPRGWSASMMSTQGPIARTMADIRAGYDAMSAENWADPFWVPARREFPVPAKVRVALVIDDGLGVDDVVKENLRRVGRLLEDAGYEVVETLPPMLETFFSLWKRVGVLDMVLGLVRMLPQIDDAGLTTAMTNWTNTFPEATGETFLKALQDRDMLIRAWNAFFAEHQLLVTPMMTKPTIP